MYEMMNGSLMGGMSIFGLLVSEPKRDTTSS